MLELTKSAAGRVHTTIESWQYASLNCNYSAQDHRRTHLHLLLSSKKQDFFHVAVTSAKEGMSPVSNQTDADSPVNSTKANKKYISSRKILLRREQSGNNHRAWPQPASSSWKKCQLHAGRACGLNGCLLLTFPSYITACLGCGTDWKQTQLRAYVPYIFLPTAVEVEERNLIRSAAWIKQRSSGFKYRGVWWVTPSFRHSMHNHTFFPINKCNTFKHLDYTLTSITWEGEEEQQQHFSKTKVFYFCQLSISFLKSPTKPL